MTQTPLTNLQDASNGFLSDIQEQDSLIPGAILVTASYHNSAFAQPLFDAMGIPCPAKLSHAVDKRRADYLAGRAMAHSAMSRLDHPLVPITNQPSRAPLWPEGLSGSISHARGRCACLLSRDTTHTYGVDTEAIAQGRSLTAILSETLNDRERTIIAQDTGPAAANATLVFSAKEALFKALFPTVGHHFGFDAAELIAPPADNTMTLTLTTDLTKDLIKGRCFDLHYRRTDTHVLTWLSVPIA
ncbi:4'-phosphopantetheinyl transferase family protein [Marivita sp.]|uniref:4'-phosphopantetheinyl transferase family protein n=1 Tax=Marivita sp. TaxID=2003365 RepID=UPI003F6A7B87